MTENERRFVDMIVNLEKYVAEVREYIKTNFDVDSHYDASTLTLRLYVTNVNNALQILAAREYVEREYPELEWILDSAREVKENEKSKTILPMKKLFFDMDGVLVNFQSGIDKLSEETKREYEGRLDEVPGIFSLMDPMPGAIEAVHKLSEYYDIYILSTAPWNNLTAPSDKIQWLTKHFGDLFKKRVIITHCKHLVDGDYLVDDRAKNGASEFPGVWVQFGTKRYPDWEEVTRFLISETYLHDDDDEKIKRRKVNYTLVEKTLKTLDDYMKTLNAQCDTAFTDELNTKIIKLAQLTNKWLEVAGEEREEQFYDI